MLWQPLELTLVTGTHTEVELKTQLSTRGHVTKEEELKSFLTDARTVELHLR